MCIFCERVKAQAADMDMAPLSVGQMVNSEKCQNLRKARLPVRPRTAPLSVAAAG